MNPLEQYVRLLQENPAGISDLFADDGYFYDGGMKLMGWPQCCFCGKQQIHSAFANFKGSTHKVLVNGNAIRYDVHYKGVVFEAIGVATVNAANKIQTFVAEVLPNAHIAENAQLQGAKI